MTTTLDPRRRGEAPDVEIWSYPEPYRTHDSGLRSWAYSINGGPHDSYAQGFTSEAETLAAAREQAGFAYVALEPCSQSQEWVMLQCDALPDEDPLCPDCHWKLSAHGTAPQGEE